MSVPTRWRSPKVVRAAVSAVVLCVGAAASASGITPHTGPLEDAVGAALEAVSADPPKAAAARKVAALLAKKSNARSFVNELRSVGAALKVAEAKLPEQTALLTEFDTASVAYRNDLETARYTLRTAAGSPSLPKALRAKAGAALKRFEKALPPKVAKPTALDLRYGQFVAAATAAKGYTPYDAGATHDWVVSSLALAPATEGVDLDGDGTPDNQLAQLQSLVATIAPGTDLSASLTDALTANGTFAMVEMWYVQSLTADPFVLTGVLNATDADADPSNNYGGAGQFTADPSTIDGDGHPLVRVATSVTKGGKYTIDFTGQGLLLGGIALPENAIVIMTGRATDASNDGYLGFSISMTTIQSLLSGAGVTLDAFQLLFLNSLLDLDTDGNGSKDALSASFAFGAVSANVAR